MKTKFLIIITSLIVISCSTPSEKLQNAQGNVIEANQDLDQANKEYLTDIENYRKEASERIIRNEKSIAQFNARIENEKTEAKTEYKKKIMELEQKNTDMKKKMDDYKESGKEKWELFKIEFNHDMDQLGQDFKNLTINNIK